MHERCAVCDLKFEREAGYFLGAMYISYALALLTIGLLSLTLWILTGFSLLKIVIAAMILFLPLALPLTLLARVLWIYIDQAIDPENIYHRTN